MGKCVKSVALRATESSRIAYSIFTSDGIFPWPLSDFRTRWLKRRRDVAAAKNACLSVAFATITCSHETDAK